MSLFFLRFFGFGHLNRSIVRGLAPKIDKMGCPDFGPQIGHFRGGFGSAGPIFANFRHFSATNIGGYLIITREWFLNFLSLFDNLPFRPSKTRAHRGRIATRKRRGKRRNWDRSALRVRPVFMLRKWARALHSFRDWQFSAFGAWKVQATPEA